ncbi:hypothetical protein FLA4_00110 [Candidatus Rickettsia kotlanii]|nr:hypothetical protein FLA4_00110 [Candidatus Rickettsia kotlanii]BDU60843.1 hypothetical protein HM2_00110 [Candidatus Rickettsia kotlanii]
MKQIQPKRIANPSNCGEEIAAKDRYNKDFLLESIMYSSDADYIGSDSESEDSEDDDSYASILLLKIKEPECKIHLDLVNILSRKCGGF